VKANAWRETAQTQHLVARSLENDNVSLLLVSLDDTKIAKSRRLLLTAVCRSANTGQAWQDDLQTLASWGRGPITIVPVAGKLALCGLADAKVVRATPWTSAAVPQTAAVPLTRTEDAWELSLDVPTVWWEITLE